MALISLLDDNTFNKVNNRLGAINGALIPAESDIKVIDPAKGWLLSESVQPIEDNIIVINYGAEIGQEIRLKPNNPKGIEELKNWVYGKPFKIGAITYYVNNALLMVYGDKYLIDIDLMTKEGAVVGGIQLPTEFLELIK